MLGRHLAVLALLGCSERAAPPEPKAEPAPSRLAVAPVVIDRVDCAKVATDDLIPTFFAGTRLDRYRTQDGTSCHYTLNGPRGGSVQVRCESKPISDDDVRARLAAFTEATPVEGIGRGAHQFDKRMIRFWHPLVPSCSIEVEMRPDDPRLLELARTIDARITALGHSVREPSAARP